LNECSEVKVTKKVLIFFFIWRYIRCGKIKKKKQLDFYAKEGKTTFVFHVNKPIVVLVYKKIYLMLTISILLFLV